MGGQAGGAGILEEARSTVGPLWDVPGQPLPIHSNFSRKAGVPGPLWQRGSPESRALQTWLWALGQATPISSWK